MKILRFEAENIKRLRVVQITPTGNLIQIMGPNGEGKTSVLDAIWYALGGTKAVPSQPVRRGASTAQVKLDMGELKVTRRFTEAGGTSLVVEGADGARFSSPQKMLDELVGTLTFDPLEFARMEATDQMETLRGMVKLEVDIDALDRQNEIDFNKRTEVNRLVKQLEARVGAIIVPPIPAKRYDVSVLLKRIEEASTKNTQIGRETVERENALRKTKVDREQAASYQQEALSLHRRAEELEKRATDMLTHAAADEARIAALPPLEGMIDVGDLRSKIEEARRVQAAVDEKKRRDAIDAELEQTKAEAKALTAAMENRTEQRAQAIASANMPVAGLSFGQGEVLFNGLPFNQASSAEQLRVSVAIAMAANPKLRVLRIQDGSLLDKKSLKMIAEMAEKGDYQIWMETVETSGKVGVVMEDGYVAEARSA